MQETYAGATLTRWEGIRAQDDEFLATFTPNQSGIRPVQYMVLVKPDEVEKATKGGIILPETKVEKDEFQRMEGLLVAVSPMAFTHKDWPDDMAALKPKVGDRVTFARYNATEIMGRDGGKYWLMKDESILGVME
jgi:co-chaperonin GroES (HSP10)